MSNNSVEVIIRIKIDVEVAQAAAEADTVNSQDNQDPDHPSCAHGLMRYVPGGKRANGTTYSAFWGCPNPNRALQCAEVPIRIPF